MSAAAVLAEVQRRGIELRVDGDRLRFRPATAVDSGLRELLTRHKPELLSILRNERASVPTVPHELSIEERVELGYVNPGWTPRAWVARLRQLAGRCEALRPDLAEQYQTWAGNIENRLDRRPGPCDT